MTEYDFNYRQKMVDDLLEQFRGKKNIGVLMESYAQQFQEVYDFLMSMLNLLDLEACTGVQLDLIGEIVVLSRYEDVYKRQVSPEPSARSAKLFRV